MDTIQNSSSEIDGMEAVPPILISPAEAARLVGYHRHSLRRIPDFPRPVRLASNKSAYALTEVRDWAMRKIAERDSA